MKKALALLLALMMTAAMGVTSFADIPVIDLTEEIGSASGTFIKISDSDIWTAPPSSTDSSATYYTSGMGGTVYFSMIFKPGTYKDIKVETTGIVTAELLKYNPAVHSANDEKWESLSSDITFSVNDSKTGGAVEFDKVTTTVNKGTYDEIKEEFTVTEEGKPSVSYTLKGEVEAGITLNEEKTEQTVVTVETIETTADYTEVRAAAKALNDAGKTTRYEAVTNQDVHIVKVKVENNFGANYAKGSFQVKATGVADGKAYAGIKNNVVADVAIVSGDTVKYYAENFKAGGKGAILPINDASGKAEFGYWDFYENRMSSDKAFVVSTTAFRSIVGKGLTLANKAENPSVIVEIPNISNIQKGVNFLNDSGVKYKKEDGVQVLDNFYLTFYGNQLVTTDFTVTWKLGVTYAELLRKFGLDTDESELVRLNLNMDGKNSTVLIDYSKVALNDEVEIQINRKGGSTLGKYVLSANKINAGGNNGGSTGGNGNESNPNTGAPDFIGMAAAAAIVSSFAVAAVALKKRK